MRDRIVVVGSLNMDLVVHAPRYPQPGETILGSEFHTFPGGKGANQAVAAARLGGQVAMIGRAGQDDFGDTLLQILAEDRVDTTHIVRDSETPSGIALITIDASGQNRIVVVPGANGRLTTADVSEAEEAFRGASALLVQLECPLPAVSHALKLGRKHGLRTVLNPAPAQPLGPAFLSNVDYLVPNESELALLAGTHSVGEAVRQLHHLGVRCVVVTLGERGALVNDEEGEAYLPAHRVAAVDTSAAGDAFVGAFAVALTEGRTTKQAAAWGNAAGALAVTRSGAQPSLPTRAELTDFLAEV